MNLLIVDDDMIAVKGMASGIDWKSCGIDGQVWTAHDTVGADEIIDRETVDVILCDIEMPGENGIELIRRVHVSNPEIVCVFLTCHAKFEYAQEALRMGCQDYILTPAPYDTIAETVRKVVSGLAQSRQSKEMQRYGAEWLRGQEKSAEVSQGDHRSASEVVESISGYIISNLASGELSVSNLASLSYLNKDYLNRIFKREKGVSINQYIITERMKLAAILLQSPNLSFQAVASQVGYSNYSYFVSAFKSFYGYTPTQYRERIKNARLGSEGSSMK